MLRRARLLIPLVACLLLTACESIGYYTQAAGGQWQLLRQREKLENLIDDPQTPPELRQTLATVLDIRQFALDELGLEHNGNFGTYVDLQRRFVVWNVFAAPEFSMTPVNWCYPIAGCVSYRGYFSEQKARDFARRQQEKGMEVYVGGVAAYSTLGWFADPLLNTVTGRDAHDLASLIFHELAHQKVYLKGDTDFNESFATAVEREGLRRWLAASHDSSESQDLFNAALQDFNRQEQFVALVSQTVTELDALYAAGIQADAMRVEKQRAVERLRLRYQELKESWQGYSGYDEWFSRPLNNAQLSTVATYYRWVPAFESLLAETGGELGDFYSRVEALSRLDADERTRQLERLMPSGV